MRAQGQDFHRDAAALAEQVIPQHNYRLDAASLAGRHYGQASCRDFRGSVLRSLPHRWARREDTRLALSHFHHHKAGHGALKQRMGAPPGAHPPPWSTSPFTPQHVPAADQTGLCPTSWSHSL